MKSISKLKDEARRHEQREEWEKAIQVYLQVIRVGDEGEGEVELPLFNRIGDICVRLGRPLDAVQYYEEAADRYANDGLYNNAIALCNKALRYQPDHLELMRKLGQFSASQGFLTDARRYFLEYAERKFKAGETDTALSALADFAGVADDGEIRELLGRRLHAHGRAADALRELRTAYAMHVHAGDQGRAEAVRVTILQIDPAASLDVGSVPPTEAATDPFASAPRPSAGLPHFEPLGVEHGAGFTVVEDDDDDDAEPPRLEGLQPTGSSGAAAADAVDDLPYLDVDQAPPAPSASSSAEPVAGLEPGVLDFESATAELEALDLGSDIEFEDASYDLPADESTFVDGFEDAPADLDAASDDGEDSPYDLPLLSDDHAAAGFDLPLLGDDDGQDTGHAPLPLIGDDPEDGEDAEAGEDAAPLPFLDAGEDDAADAPLPLLGYDEPGTAFQDLPLLDDGPAGEVAALAGDDGAADGDVQPLPLLDDQEQERTSRYYDLAAFEDEPPPAPSPGTAPTDAGSTDEPGTYELPGVGLPDFHFRGETSAEAAIFEVEDTAEPQSIFRPEDLRPMRSGEPDADSDDAAAATVDNLDMTSDLMPFPLPGWADEERDRGGLPPFEDMEGVPQPFDYHPPEPPAADSPDDTAEPWAVPSEEESGPDASGADDAEAAAYDAAEPEPATPPAASAWPVTGGISFDWLDHEEAEQETAPQTWHEQPAEAGVDEDAGTFTSFSFADGEDLSADEPEPARAPGLPAGSVEPAADATEPWAGGADLEPEGAEPFTDAEPFAGGVEPFTQHAEPFSEEAELATEDAGPLADDAALFADDAEPFPDDADLFADGAELVTGGMDVLDVEGEVEQAERAAAELRAAVPGPAHEPWDKGAVLDDEDDSASHDAAFEAVPEPGREHAVEAQADDVEEWTPDRLLDPAPQPVAPQPPQSDAARSDEPSDQEGFVDLGALIRADNEEATTRFYVQENAPTGDEDRDFAELLSQFKAKISEHVPTEDAAAHYDLALAYKEMGLVDEAIAEFQIALRAGRMRLKIYEELGECFLQKRQFNIAEKVLSRALETNHEDELELLGVYYHLGRAYEEMGRTEQARDAYERVLGMDIAFQDVAERLGRL
jgi:tetratricopeptide (TPR) repeat protein